jgi:glucokinase
MEHALALAVDIGGTSVRVAVIDTEGRIVAAEKFATPPGGELDPLVGEIGARTESLLTVHRVDVPTVFVALPGRVREADGIVERAVNLPRLEGQPISAALQMRLQRQVVLRPDVSAAAYAQWKRSPSAPQRFVYLTLGTGVGGCTIIDGHIADFGSRGATHLGHVIVDTAADAAACRCGARGCLEAYVSGPALALSGVSERAVRAFGFGLLQIAHLFVPDVIAVGGGAAENFVELLPRAAGAFRRLAGRLVRPELRIEGAPLRSDDAGVIGAGLLVHALWRSYQQVERARAQRGATS